MTTQHATTAQDAAAQPAPLASPVVTPENPVPVDPAAVEETRTYLQAIQDNYGQFRATGTIPWGNAIAFNRGDAVPADYPTLDQLVSDGLVERVAPAPRSRKGK